MKRRAFLQALAALPFVGAMFKPVAAKAKSGSSAEAGRFEFLLENGRRRWYPCSFRRNGSLCYTSFKPPFPCRLIAFEMRDKTRVRMYSMPLRPEDTYFLSVQVENGFPRVILVRGKEPIPFSSRV